MPNRRRSGDFGTHRQYRRKRARRNRPELQNFEGRVFPTAVSPFSLGPMNKICPHCQAFRFLEESNNCCHNGKVELPPLADYPSELKEMILGQGESSKHFIRDIRKYNSAMAFASFGCSVMAPPNQWNPTFKIHGQVYHRSGCLHPSEGTSPTYSQLYILEGHQAVEARLQVQANQTLRRNILIMLDTLLHRVNPYAAAYKHMADVERAMTEEAIANDQLPSTVTMYFKRGPDQRRYNDPMKDEVAAVFT